MQHEEFFPVVVVRVLLGGGVGRPLVQLAGAGATGARVVGGRGRNVVPGGVGARRRGWTQGNAARVPVAVVLEHVKKFGAERVDQVGPRLPQRLHDKVDEADLHTVAR